MYGIELESAYYERSIRRAENVFMARISQSKLKATISFIEWVKKIKDENLT